MAQVQSRLEERSDIFYSLLMSILASTLAQVGTAQVTADFSGPKEFSTCGEPQRR